MTQYILAIDQGTTSCRAIIYTAAGTVVAKAQHSITQYFPNDAWVEHDPKEILAKTILSCEQALANGKLTAADIVCIGVTNQRETTVLWDKNTGEPIHNAIVWQDRRTADYCEQLLQDGLQEMVK